MFSGICQQTSAHVAPAMLTSKRRGSEGGTAETRQERWIEPHDCSFVVLNENHIKTHEVLNILFTTYQQQ